MYNKQLWFESPIQPAPTTLLKSRGLSGGIVVYQADGNASVYGQINTALDQALQTAVKVTDQNGQPVSMTQFQGGWLANGCPLNVFFGQGWITGQQDALRAAGMTQCLPAAPLTYGTVPASVTTTPAQGAPYTSTLTQGGIITQPSSPAPQTTVINQGAPTSPTMYDTGITPAPAPAAAPDYTMYAIFAIAAILLLKRG